MQSNQDMIIRLLEQAAHLMQGRIAIPPSDQATNQRVDGDASSATGSSSRPPSATYHHGHDESTTQLHRENLGRFETNTVVQQNFDAGTSAPAERLNNLVVPPRTLLQSLVQPASNIAVSPSTDQIQSSGAIPYDRLVGSHNVVTRHIGIESQRSLQQSSPTILAEMRRSFEPYARPSRGRIGVQRHSRSRTTAHVELESHYTVYCLGNLDENRVPTAQRLDDLLEMGLGQSSITLRRGATCEEVESAIRARFPKLSSLRFEILRAASGNAHRKPLIRICSQPIPTPDVINGFHVRGLYIRPSINLSPEDAEMSDADSSSNSNSTPCLSPGASFFSTSGNSSSSNNENARYESARSVAQEPSPVPNLEYPSTSGSPHGGFHFSLTESLETFRDESELVTIEEYRDDVYLKHSGFQHIFIQRCSFMDDILGFYMKDNNVDYRKKTIVKFLGESGTDVNALTKEFFFEGMKLLKSARFYESHVLLEGIGDYLLPSCDPALRASGYYRFLGKFMGHDAIHVGVGFIGFSGAAISYIFRADDNLPIVLCPSDIPNLELREIWHEVENWASTQVPPSADVYNKIVGALQSANIYTVPCQANLRLLLQQFAFWHVFYSRATCLEEIREGIKATGVFKFIQKRKYLWKSVFPNESQFCYTPSQVIQSIRYEGSAPSVVIKSTLEAFIRSLDNGAIRSLMECWTGSPVIPSDGLEVRLVTAGRFHVHACFSQLEIPDSMTAEDLNSALALLLSHGVLGFGSA